MANEKLFHVGVKAIISNADDKVLILEVNTQNFKLDKTPHDDLPGGRIGADEQLDDTLRRELLEEVGITDIDEIRFVTAVIANMEIPISDSQKVGLVLMVYEVKIPEDSEIILSKEHTSYEWVSRAEARQRLAHKYPAEFTDHL